MRTLIGAPHLLLISRLMTDKRRGAVFSPRAFNEIYYVEKSQACWLRIKKVCVFFFFTNKLHVVADFPFFNWDLSSRLRGPHRHVFLLFLFSKSLGSFKLLWDWGWSGILKSNGGRGWILFIIRLALQKSFHATPCSCIVDSTRSCLVNCLLLNCQSSLCLCRISLHHSITPLHLRPVLRVFSRAVDISETPPQSCRHDQFYSKSVTAASKCPSSASS